LLLLVLFGLLVATMMAEQQTTELAPQQEHSSQPQHLVKTVTH
jgi:hypothetical protein